MTISTAKKIACLATLAALPSLSAGQSATLVYGNVNGWTVHTDPSQNYRCFAEALYEGGSSIRIGFNADSELYLSITDSSWSGTVAGKQYDVALQFDEESPTTFRAVGAAESSGLSVIVPSNRLAEFRKEFATRYMVSAHYGNQEPVMLSLGGSFRATTMLDECQTLMASVAAGTK
jgi:hypothetical protein